MLNSLSVRECQLFQGVGENIVFHFFLLPNNVATLLKYAFSTLHVI